MTAPELDLGNWCRLLTAMQLSGKSEYVLRRHVAMGEVRIKEDRGGRHLYHRGDCAQLREVAQERERAAAPTAAA